MIENARKDWVSIQAEPVAEEDIPLPLVRLKVEYSGGYEVENARRFSNRFVGRVANIDDVIQFHKRRTQTSSGARSVKLSAPDIDTFGNGSLSLEKIKVQNLVEGYLKDYSLELLPENGLGDAVTNFVDKDDRQAVKSYVLFCGFEA